MNSDLGRLGVVLLLVSAAGIHSAACIGDRAIRSSQTGLTPIARLPSPPHYLISASGMGDVRLGTTLEQARRALPDARFVRTTDGEGAALVQVTLAPGASVIVSAEEDDPEAPIDWSRRIAAIETFSPSFHTPDRVRPGSRVRDVEKVYGPVIEIVQSEIEARQFVTFAQQPPHLTFRLDSTGLFPPGSRRTKGFEPAARIHSVTVAAP